jgi:2-hydroxymuconate-semialdehyde hydrolase
MAPEEMPFERRRAATAGGEMAYVDAAVSEGPAVVLLHGFPTSSHLWRREIGLLAPRFRVIAPDLLGYGASEKPEDADLTEPAQAGYVGELLRQLGIERAALVGHHIGGAVAQMLALDGPVEAAALVLMDTLCFEAWPVAGVGMVPGTAGEEETAELVEEVLRGVFALGIGHQRLVTTEMLDGYRRPWLDDPPAFFRAARQISGRGLAGREAELAELDLPALLIWGEEDPFLPAALGERLQDVIPGASLALLPGCSHFVTEDAPSTVGPLVHEYLRTRYLQDAHRHAAPGGPVPVYLERPTWRQIEDADDDPDRREEG